jgi:phosphoribosylglycinamide formyltransferase 1
MIALGFLASHNGTSLRAIINAIEAGALAARACLVVSNNRAAPALEFARQHGAPTRVIATLADPDAADAALAAALHEAGVELVVLSGYLRRIGPRTLCAYRNRILNVHPALLPAFGGEGMYGRRVHEAVVASGAHLTGATVHLVDDEYDRGAVVARVKLPVAPDDTPERIERRVMAAEPGLFIQTLQRIAAGSLRLPAA